jgi:hypothetical protein
MISRTRTSHRRAGCLLACLLAVVGSASAAAGHPGFGARLLLAQKDGRVALFLPESHIGSPAQEDAYFRAVIRPAFAASSALLAERSSVSWFDKTYDQATCQDEGEAEAALDPALNDALQKHAPAAPPAPAELPPALRSVAPVDRIGTPGRFMRFYLLFMNVHQRAYGAIPAEAGARSFRIRNAQSAVLLVAAPRRVVSVEDTGTWLRAYCALGPEQRASMIAETIMRSGRPPDIADAGKTGAELRDATYRDNDAAYRRALHAARAALRSPDATGLAAARQAGDAHAAQASTAGQLAIDRFTLAERSRAWVAALPAALQRERLPFYALGAAHFADGPHGPGLITLLREAGYTISVLADRRALDAALAGVPPAPSPSEAIVTARAMAGGCERSGDSYACNWSDKTTSYLVVSTLPAQRQEAWSACFEREGMHGPEKRCVSSLREAGAERAADLHAASHTTDIDTPPSAKDP